MRRAENFSQFLNGESLETYINETIIRAIECLYVQRRFSACYEEYVRDYEEEGFVKIRAVKQLLEKIDGSSLKECFEQIMSVF